MEIKEY